MIKRTLIISVFVAFVSAVACASDDIKVWFSNPDSALAPSPLSHDSSKRIDEALYDFIDSAQQGATVYVAIFEMNLNGSGDAAPLKNIKGLLNAKRASGTAVYVAGHSTVSLAGLTFPTTVYRAAYEGEGTEGSGGLMHNKFVVLKDSAVWTGSYNFTVSATLQQDNNAVSIYSPELSRVFETEFINMYGPPLGRSTKEFGAIKVSSAVAAGTNVSGSSVTLPGGSVIKVYFNPYTLPKTIATAIEDEILSPTRTAIPAPRESVFFATAWFSRLSITEAMRESLGANAAVGIAGVMDDQSSNNTVYYSLKNSSVAVTWDSRRSSFGSGLMHHKFGVIDPNLKNARTITGSANWSNSGATADGNNNDENIVIIYDPSVSGKYYKEFRRMFALTGAVSPAAFVKSVDNVVMYPSPARTSAVIGFDISALVEKITVKIYTLSGELARAITPETYYPGFYNEVAWDLKNTAGQRVAPGLYFIKVEVETPDGKFFALKKAAVGK
ncbi:MAG: phospholipase D-like domain-containing protein [Endomicrobiia bacterium]|nr:phospholipase D-like domain-containing protein [Endomicrobiia bacterium]